MDFVTPRLNSTLIVRPTPIVRLVYDDREVEVVDGAALIENNSDGVARIDEH